MKWLFQTDTFIQFCDVILFTTNQDQNLILESKCFLQILLEAYNMPSYQFLKLSIKTTYILFSVYQLTLLKIPFNIRAKPSRKK